MPTPLAATVRPVCGVAGILAWSRPSEDGERQVAQMVDALHHRGPDDGGVAAGDGWAIGMRRLAIIDLSAAGHQPMASGDHVLVFNGEVYNFAELREELAALGHTFRGGSDTEVVLEAFRAWGPARARALQRLLRALRRRHPPPRGLARARPLRQEAAVPGPPARPAHVRQRAQGDAAAVPRRGDGRPRRPRRLPALPVRAGAELDPARGREAAAGVLAGGRPGDRDDRRAAGLLAAAGARSRAVGGDARRGPGRRARGDRPGAWSPTSRWARSSPAAPTRASSWPACAPRPRTCGRSRSASARGRTTSRATPPPSPSTSARATRRSRSRATRR